MALALDTAQTAVATHSPLLALARHLNTLPRDQGDAVLTRYVDILPTLEILPIDASPSPDMDADEMAFWSGVYDLLEELAELIALQV